MRYILPLFFGFISAATGTSLPGLINMTAAKVSIRDGRDRALLFITGAVIIIIFQTLSAILFARFIDSRPDIVVMLREIGFAIFMALSIYFLFLAKKPKVKKEEMKMRSKTNRFFLGMLLSALNFFPVPYYVFVTILLSSYRLFIFERVSISLFLIGVTLGSFIIFYYYNFFFKNMNQIIGTITGTIALIALINIIKYYY